MTIRIACLLASALAVGCGDPELTCVEVDLTCAPLYAPTWDNLYTTTIAPTCAVAGCHTRTTAKGGLALDDAATAHPALARYVVAGDVACSELTMRVFSSESSLVMPRGARLSPAEACAVAHWVAAGAPGPITATRTP